MGITICLLETAYPIFIWMKRSTRSIWLAAILAMHAAIGLMMGMYLFAFVMIVLNLAAFAPDLSGYIYQSFAARLARRLLRSQID